MSGEEQGKSSEIDWSMILVAVKSTVRRFSGGTSSVGRVEADHVVSDTVLVLLRRFSRLPIPTKTVVYARAVAVNRCKKLLKTQGDEVAETGDKTELLGDRVASLVADEGLPTPTENTLATVRMFEQLYEELTPHQTEVLTDWLQDGCTRRVAKEMDLDRTSVKSALMRIKKKLRIIRENSKKLPPSPPS